MDEKKLLDELKVLANDEGFMEELFTTENHTEFAEKLKTKNIELSEEEAKLIYEEMKAENGELSEENLDDVAGGGILAGIVVGVGIGAFIKGLIDGFNSKRK